MGGTSTELLRTCTFTMYVHVHTVCMYSLHCYVIVTSSPFLSTDCLSCKPMLYHLMNTTEQMKSGLLTCLTCTYNSLHLVLHSLYMYIQLVCPQLLLTVQSILMCVKFLMCISTPPSNTGQLQYQTSGQCTVGIYVHVHTCKGEQT